jgi:Peptidase S24-like
MTINDPHRKSTVDARKCELVAEVLRVSDTVCLRVTGWSMLPSIWPGDTLIVRRVKAQELKVGKILLCRRAASLFAHRIVSVADLDARGRVGVRGDALPVPDEPILQSEILGIVTGIIRRGKQVRPSTHLRFRERLVGTVIWHSDLLARFVLFVHLICSPAWWTETLSAR